MLCFVAVSPANLVLGKFLCLWKTAVYTLTGSRRDSLDFISKVTNEGMEAPFMGFATTYRFSSHCTVGWAGRRNGAPLLGRLAERFRGVQAGEGFRETSQQPFSP